MVGQCRVTQRIYNFCLLTQTFVYVLGQKTFHQIRQTTIQYAWEAVLVYGGRIDGKRKPMVRDWISGVIAMRKGLQGAKPTYFNHWILDLLNVYEEDDLVDLFPGSLSMQEPCESRGINYIPGGNK